jgi:hypothetical protein
MLWSLACVASIDVLTAQAEEAPPPPPPPPGPFDTNQWNPVLLPGPPREGRFDLSATRAWLLAEPQCGSLELHPEGVAWLVLGRLAAGSTMRVGSDKKSIKECIERIRGAQTENGRFDGFPVPTSPRAQLLLTLAIEAAHTRSHYALLEPVAAKAVAACLAEADGPLDAERFALLAVLAAQLERGSLAALAAECRDLARRARPALRPGAMRRGDAALHLGDVLLGAAADPMLTVARCWPANAGADPLHTWFGVLALQATDAATWRRESASLQKLLAVRTSDGADAGCWPAAAGLDAALTTAVLAAAVAEADCNVFGDGPQSGGR